MARHTFIPHTAETVLRLEASDPEALWAEACRALGRAFVEETGEAGPGPGRVLVIEAVDVDAVLVDLLNELIYIAETERWAPADAEVVAWEALRLTVRLPGVALARAPARIKSATHHGARITHAEAGVSAEVILDI